ncbi:MAG: hypothetical protein PHT84_06035, partial [Candidatus Pacebacteria bacterium]|nr:hypothetical protein [Candidatus Paceibacterota bacterium]
SKSFCFCYVLIIRVFKKYANFSFRKIYKSFQPKILKRTFGERHTNISIRKIYPSFNGKY